MTDDQFLRYYGDPNMLLDLSQVTFHSMNKKIQDRVIQGRHPWCSSLTYLGYLLQCSELDLSRIPFLGVKGLDVIKEFLTDLSKNTGGEYRLLDDRTPKPEHRERDISYIKPSIKDIQTFYRLPADATVISEPVNHSKPSVIPMFNAHFTKDDFIAVCGQLHHRRRLLRDGDVALLDERSLKRALLIRRWHAWVQLMRA